MKKEGGLHSLEKKSSRKRREGTTTRREKTLRIRKTEKGGFSPNHHN